LIYSTLIINGPFCLEKIVKELEEKMKIEGKNNLKSIKS
jgi:dihydroorotate dehydrogenase